LQELAQLGAGLHLILALHLGQTLDQGFGGRGQAADVHARTGEQGAGAISLSQHGEQEVGRFDVSVVRAQGQGLRIAQRFLEFGGEFVHSHAVRSSIIDGVYMRPLGPISRACGPEAQALRAWMPQRASAASSLSRASTQCAPDGVCSFFQNGAWVLR